MQDQVNGDSTGRFDRDLGERVRTVRIYRNMSQRELGAAIGVPREHLQNYEKGAMRITRPRSCGSPRR